MTRLVIPNTEQYKIKMLTSYPTCSREYYPFFFISPFSFDGREPLLEFLLVFCP